MTTKEKHSPRKGKNGRRNTNRVKQGFLGFKGWRYHPTKGFRKDATYNPEDVRSTKVSALEERITHSEGGLI